MQIKTIILFIAVTLGVLGGVGGLLWQFGQASEKPIADVAGSSIHKTGTGDVIIVEFSDFQCPACRDYEAPLKDILAKYEGKATFVYRYYPLVSIHKNAQLSAQAAEAASMQGQFWQMHDRLFATQTIWAEMSDPTETFVGYAKELNLDTAKFVIDLTSQAVKDVINIDVLDANRYRISGTPTFYVNGIKTEFGQIDAKIGQLVK